MSEFVDDASPQPEVNPTTYGVVLEPRCRVCRHEVLCQRVNALLVRGAGYAAIVRALASEIGNQSDADRITVDSVRNHAARHFPVQEASHATYREILERRAREIVICHREGTTWADCLP